MVGNAVSSALRHLTCFEQTLLSKIKKMIIIKRISQSQVATTMDSFVNMTNETNADATWKEEIRKAANRLLNGYYKVSERHTFFFTNATWQHEETPNLT
jgi:hypothetical protein